MKLATFLKKNFAGDAKTLLRGLVMKGAERVTQQCGGYPIWPQSCKTTCEQVT